MGGSSNKVKSIVYSFRLALDELTLEVPTYFHKRKLSGTSLPTRSRRFADLSEMAYPGYPVRIQMNCSPMLSLTFLFAFLACFFCRPLVVTPAPHPVLPTGNQQATQYV